MTKKHKTRPFLLALVSGVAAMAVLVVLCMACSVSAASLVRLAAQTYKLTPLVYLPPGQPPNGKVGEPYAGYAFCRPAPAPGLFCGKVLPKNPITSNPSGGTPNYTFSASPGLPFGLTLNLNGNLIGTPTKAGTYNFQICATDRVGKKKCWPIRGVVIAPKDIVNKYPGAAIEVMPGMFMYFTIGETDQGAKSFGRLVRDFTLDVPAGFTILESTRRERQQTHVCYDISSCGEDCGACFGPVWTMQTPDGCRVDMTLYGMSYDKPANQTKFKLGIVNGTGGCPAGANSTYYSFQSANLTGTKVLPNGGLSATVRLVYEVSTQSGLSFKQLPDFTVTVGAVRPLRTGEKLRPEQDPVMD